MSTEQEFFRKLEDKAEFHPLKDRLEEELRDHVEDASTTRQQTIKHSVERLGTPQKIIRELHDVNVSWGRFGIFALSCSLVFIIDFIVQFRNYHYFGEKLTNVDTFINILLNFSPLVGLLVPLISSIVLVGKRYHFSTGELFWYGFVFGVLTNGILFMTGYYFKSIDVMVELNYGGVNGLVFKGVLSFFGCIVFGSLAMVGGMLRKEMLRRKYLNFHSN